MDCVIENGRCVNCPRRFDRAAAAGIDLARLRTQCSAGGGPAAAVPQIRGAGYFLKRSLRRLGVFSRGGCGCERLAAEMDSNGPAWCREHLAEIVDQMAAEAAKRKLLRYVFNRSLAERLVMRAIIRTERERG